MFGRVAITWGIGPHSSIQYFLALTEIVSEQAAVI